ncbi:MAG: SDR family oxidoreductase [Thaumarchaeota archaeon]|nr:MAG: SDR family oxidoreductase [Nitrososphaerota archaeon]
MAGRVCVVTGANSGIGKATAMGLAEMGATVILVCRSKEKGEAALSEIREKSGNNSLALMLADMSSMRSVRQLASEFRSKYDRLHVLVNNAGLFMFTRTTTGDRLETTFEVDYLSHFLLTGLLIDLLKASAPSRLVEVSSIAHYNGHIDFDDLQGEKGYGGWKAYSQAKLAQVLFTYELARRLKGTGVTANCLHPGAVATNIWSRPLGRAGFIMKLLRLFMMGPEGGAKTPIYLASSPDVEGVSGKYFTNKKEKESSKESNDEQVARRLWLVSEDLTGLPE